MNDDEIIESSQPKPKPCLLERDEVVDSSQPNSPARGLLDQPIRRLGRHVLKQTPVTTTESKVPTSRATTPPLSENVFIFNIRFQKLLIPSHHQKDTRQRNHGRTPETPHSKVVVVLHL